MFLMSTVCAEFHDRTGAVLFAIHPADLMSFIDAPESIRQDPLFDMLVRDGSVKIPSNKDEIRKLENDPVQKVAEVTEEKSSAAPAEEKSSNRKSAEKK